jgi:hypothetical protein
LGLPQKSSGSIYPHHHGSPVYHRGFFLTQYISQIGESCLSLSNNQDWARVIDTEVKIYYLAAALLNSWSSFLPTFGSGRRAWVAIRDNDIAYGPWINIVGTNFLPSS